MVIGIWRCHYGSLIWVSAGCHQVSWMRFASENGYSHPRSVWKVMSILIGQGWNFQVAQAVQTCLRNTKCCGLGNCASFCGFQLFKWQVELLSFWNAMVISNKCCKRKLIKCLGNKVQVVMWYRWSRNCGESSYH